MKRAFMLTAVLLSLTIHAKEIPAVKPDRAGMSAKRLARITELTQRYVDEGKIAGVLTLVARNGRIVHSSVVGARGVEDDRALTEDALFRIYSMSKPIIAVAAMILYEEGEFQLTDPVAKFLPELERLDVLVDGERVPAATPMTMQHLLTHTAGFSYGFSAADPVDELYRQADLFAAEDLDEFIARLKVLPLRFEPGTQWHYSVAADVTGAVIERISGRRLDMFLQERLFGPLDMPDTFFAVPTGKAERLLPNHYWDKDNQRLVDFDEPWLVGPSGTDSGTQLLLGGSGLVSTARDYLRFAEMLRRGGLLDGVRVLSPKTVEFMVMDHLPAAVRVNRVGERPVTDVERSWGFGFGLGFGLITDVTDIGVVGSAGEYSWGGDAGTIFWVDPVEEIVAVSMMQVMNSPWPLRSQLKVLTNQAITELN